MNKVNYNDLYKIYHHQYDEPKPKRRKKKSYFTEQRKIEKTIEKEPQRYESHVDDPMRDLLVTGAEMALGYGIAEYLGLFSKGNAYVGNVHMSSMLDNQREEYRKQGLLPPKI